MAHANRPRQSSKSARLFLSCLRANLRGLKPALALLGGSLACASLAVAQQPSQPHPVVAAASPAAGPMRLQNYNVPSDLVGTFGARLQIQYSQQPEVRVTTDPKTGQLMVMAPELIQRQIAAQVQNFMASAKINPQTSDKGMAVASYQQQTYHLRNLSWRELEDSLTKLAGSKLSVTTERNGELAVFRVPNSTGMQDILQIDRRMNQVNVLGAGLTTAGWMQVMYSLDEGQVDRQKTTHIVPLTPAEPRRVKRAFQLVNATLPQNEQATGSVKLNQQGNPNDPATAIIGKDMTNETGLFGDVQIEFIEELDLVIVRGSKRDVERTLEVIEKIKAQATETQPEIDVFDLSMQTVKQSQP